MKLNFWKNAIDIIKKTIRFCGGRVLKWLFIGNVCSFGQGYFEFLVLVFLQLFLKKFDLLQDNLSVPFLPQAESFPSAIIISILFFILFLNFAFQYVTITSGAMSAILISARLRIKVYYELLQLKKPKFISAAMLNYSITELAQHTAAFYKATVDLLNLIVQALVYVFIMFFLTWKLSLLSMVALGVMGIMLIKINKSIHPFSKQLPQQVIAINKSIQRVARNWLLVHILRTHNTEYEYLLNKEIKYHMLNLRITFLYFMSSELPRTLGAVLVVGIVIINILFFQVPGHILICFVFILLRFSQMIAKMSHSFSRLIASYPFFKEALANYDVKPNSEISTCFQPIELIGMNRAIPVYRNERIDSYNNLEEISSPPLIELNNVTFSYDDKTAPVFENLNLKIKQGKQAGIIGRSGSGKTTILGLILGLLEPREGQVLINKEPSSSFFSKYKIRVGYVGSEPFLIEGSLLDNLNYGCIYEKPSLEQLNHALKMAQLYDFIQTIPEGLNYKINENGEGLSAGQKQRLGLARSLLLNPQLIILDEVSANLDNETESEIAETLNKLSDQCTTVIVSHKPGILKYARNIISLDKIKGNNINEAAQVS